MIFHYINVVIHHWVTSRGDGRNLSYVGDEVDTCKMDVNYLIVKGVSTPFSSRLE